MSRLTLLLLVLLVLPLAVAGAGAEPASQGESIEALLKQVSKPVLDTTRAVRVHNVEIDMGPGVLVLGSGILAPSTAIAGRTFELAFVGDARFRMHPPDEIEAGQLELFAGEAPLTTQVTHAVLVVGNPGVTQRLLGATAPGPPDEAELRDAVSLFKEWVGSPERDGFAVTGLIVKSLMGETEAEAYLAAWCRTPELGDFYYSVDPFRPEQVELGQFVAADIRGYDVWTQNRIRRFLKREKLVGRFADVRLEQLGEWDTWVAAGLRSEQGTPTHGSSGFEPEHYVLDMTVDPRYELDAWGTARIRIRAVSHARRTVDFSLYSGLRVKGVYGSDDQPLQWIRSSGAFSVVLPEPVPAGERVELRVDYEGDLLERTAERDRAFRLLTTRGWYPHTGSLDRATYDVTLRWPEKFALMASGRVVDSGEGAGLRWERRVLDVRAEEFTFEVGQFDVVKEHAGHIDLTFAFPRHLYGLRPKTQQEVVDTTKAALAVFEEKFGPYPLDYLTVVVVDRSFSQGFLSMATLAEGAMNDPFPAERNLTIAHEVAHQWWGNWVGWDSYRDQWLSEALAEYSALMFGASTAQSNAGSLARRTSDWRGPLLAPARGGRMVESLGPVVLGYRLDSSRAPDAYEAIVYGKGTVVFRMLALKLGEGPFAAMLGELAQAVGNRVIDTATFFRAIEHMSGMDLQPFARQFVYGTGIPELYFRYAIEEAPQPENWIIRGEVFQVSRGRTRYVLGREPGAHWELRSEFVPNLDIDKSTVVVPIQVILTPPAEVQPGKRDQPIRGLDATLVVQGAASDFELTIPERPELMTVDPSAVLATFCDENLEPKRTLRIRARQLAAAGDLAAAEEVLREALAAPLFSELGIAWLRPEGKTTEDEVAQRRAAEDARIHTLLARIQIEKGAVDEARRELAQGDALMANTENAAGGNERRILWSRLDLARGEYESAFRRLREGRSSWGLDGEGHAILAAAAYETGRHQIADESIEMAESRGVDMSVLRTVRDSNEVTGSGRKD